MAAVGNDNDDDLPHDSPSSKHSTDAEVVQLAEEKLLLLVVVAEMETAKLHS